MYSQCVFISGVGVRRAVDISSNRSYHTAKENKPTVLLDSEREHDCSSSANKKRYEKTDFLDRSKTSKNGI